MRNEFLITVCSIIVGIVGTILVSFISINIVGNGFENPVCAILFVIVGIIISWITYRSIFGMLFNKLCEKYPDGVIEWAYCKGLLKSVEEISDKLSFSQKKVAFRKEKEIKIKELEVREEYNKIAFHYSLGLEAFVKETSNLKRLFVIHHKDDIARLDEKENQRVRHETINQNYEIIRTQYPLGMVVWMQNNQIESTISYHQKKKAIKEKTLIAQLEEKEKKKIKRLDAQEKNRNELVLWKRQQAKFTQYCRDISDLECEMFSWCNYDIDVSINNIHNDNNYIVGQMFPYSYCSETDLDYTYFSVQKNNATNIRKNSFPVTNEVIRGIADFIYDVNYKEPSSVYFCPPQEEALNDVYGLLYKQIINAFDAEISHDRIYFPFEDNSFTFNEWVKNINRQVFVIDVCTSNTRLMDICGTITSKAVRKRPLIHYFSLYKGYDRDEMMKLIEDDKKERDAQAAIKNREEEKRDRLIKAVVSWEYLAEGFRYTHLFYYYPTTCEFEATDEEWDNRYIVWNFKNDPAKGISELEHEEALDEVIPLLKVRLIDTFEKEYLPFLTLVCLPASTQLKNLARYKEFSERLCEETRMENGYEHIHFIRDGLSKNDPNNETGRSIQPKVSFDDWFDGKYVLLFDDVVTKGNTMLRYKRKLEEVGAVVVGGICLGKTKHTRVEQ